MIVLGLIGILIFQNLDYFMTKTALKIDLEIDTWSWTIPELQNIAYFGICFLLGIILAILRGFMIKLGLKKEIRTKDAAISSLKEKIVSLKTELDVFQHDPYIKKELKKEPIVKLSEPEQPDFVRPDLEQPDFEQPDFVQPDYEQPENDIKKDPKPDTAD